MQSNRFAPRCLFFSALFICLALVRLQSARADILALDWAHLSAAYQSGAANSTTTQIFTVGSNTVSTVFGIQGNTTAANTFIDSTPTPGTNGTASPTNIYASGGTTDGELALQIGIALADTSSEGVTFTINFNQAVYGVTFKLFDLDYTSGSFTDQVHDIVGTDAPTTNTTFTPMLAGSLDNSVSGAADGFKNSVTGTANNAQNSANGNVAVTFANNQAITAVSFVYGDNTKSDLGPVAPASTTLQIIALSNVAWSTVSGVSVPEPGTFGAVGLGLAGMMAVVLRRRRQG